MLTIEFKEWLDNQLERTELPLESRITIYMKDGTVIGIDSVVIDDDGDVALSEGDAL